VTGWVTISGDASFSGGSAGTASPVTTRADADSIAANFDAVTLNTVGDAIQLTGAVTINGDIAASQQFRWGLFDGDNPVTAGDGEGYVGVWAAIGNSPTTNGLALADGTASIPFSSAAATQIAQATRTGAFGTIPANTPIVFELLIQRVSATEIEVSASAIAGAHNFTWAATTASASPSNFTYDSVSFLLGGELNASQAAFSDVQVKYVPEPASLALIALGGVMALGRRRDAQA
jgi:hypothetical protein